MSDLPYLKAGIRDFKAKLGQAMHDMWDAKNKHRDYWIEKTFGPWDDRNIALHYRQTAVYRALIN